MNSTNLVADFSTGIFSGNVELVSPKIFRMIYYERIRAKKLCK